jgi:hypothetical protein
MATILEKHPHHFTATSHNGGYGTRGTELTIERTLELVNKEATMKRWKEPTTPEKFSY